MEGMHVLGLDIFTKYFTKHITGINNLEYEQRLMALSLEYRRARVDMIEIFKIIHGFDYREIAEWICWNKRTPFQTTQGDSSY